MDEKIFGDKEYKDIMQTIQSLIDKGYTVSMIEDVLEQKFKQENKTNGFERNEVIQKLAEHDETVSTTIPQKHFQVGKNQLIRREDLKEWWDNFVCEHYMAEEGKGRLNQDDLKKSLNIVQ